jgi:hypothetical protein
MITLIVCKYSEHIKILITSPMMVVNLFCLLVVNLFCLLVVNLFWSVNLEPFITNLTYHKNLFCLLVVNLWCVVCWFGLLLCCSCDATMWVVRAICGLWTLSPIWLFVLNLVMNDSECYMMCGCHLSCHVWLHIAILCGCIFSHVRLAC